MITNSVGIRLMYVILVFSFFWVPIRVSFFNVSYLIALIACGLTFPLFLKRFHLGEILLFIFPYIFFILSTLLLVIFLSGDAREARYILLILPAPLIGLLVYGLMKEGYINFFYGIRVFVYAGFSLSLLCIVQYLNIFGLNETYYSFISESRGSAYILNNTKRVLGVYGNPNEVGFAIGAAFICLVFLKNQFNRYNYFLFYLVFLLAFLSTGSRTLFVCLVFSFLSHYLINFNIMKLFKFFFVVIAFSLLFVFFTKLSPDGNHFIQRATNYDSVLIRIDYLWMSAFEIGLESPVYGHGPARDILGGGVIPDSKWLVWWIQWGIIGVSFFFIYFFCIILFFLEKIKFN
jgi:hypothetical protein